MSNSFLMGKPNKAFEFARSAHRTNIWLRDLLAAQGGR